jgi:hypothetical protein
MTLKWWRPPLAAGHVAAQGGPANGSPAHRSLPLRRFDRTPTTPGAEPLSQAKTHWGFPFLGSPPRKEKRRGEVGEVGEGEEERGRGGSARDAAGAPRPEAVRVHGEPYQSPRRRGAGTEQEVERRREHLHRAAFFAKSATTTSRTQRESNRSLALSCVASLPWSCL